jgi:hypothetical protein
MRHVALAVLCSLYLAATTAIAWAGVAPTTNASPQAQSGAKIAPAKKSDDDAKKDSHEDRDQQDKR